MTFLYNNYLFLDEETFSTYTVSPYMWELIKHSGRVRVTSARWWDSKFQPLFPPQKHHLTMLFGPKQPNESSRMQLQSCSTPGKHKAENSYIKICRKSNFPLPMSAPPPSLHGSAPKREPPGLQILPRGERGVKHAFKILDLEGCPPKGTGFCLVSLRVPMELAQFGYLWTTENRENW